MDMLERAWQGWWRAGQRRRSRLPCWEGKVEIPPTTEKPRHSDVIMFFTVELTGQIPKESQGLKLVLGKQVRALSLTSLQNSTPHACRTFDLTKLTTGKHVFKSWLLTTL